MATKIKNDFALIYSDQIKDFSFPNEPIAIIIFDEDQDLKDEDFSFQFNLDGTFTIN